MSPTTFSARLVHCKSVAFLFLLNFGANLEDPIIRLEQSYSKVEDIISKEKFKPNDGQFTFQVNTRTVKILQLKMH